MAAGESSIAEVAAALRAELYSGVYPPGSRLPTREEIAGTADMSKESAGTALRILRDEGLVQLRQGGGTFALERDIYQVTLVIPYTGPPGEWKKIYGAASGAARSAVAALPGVTSASTTQNSDMSATLFATVDTGVGRIDAALAWAVRIAGRLCPAGANWGHPVRAAIEHAGHVG